MISMLDKHELIKILGFIIKNKDITISDGELYGSDTLVSLWKAIRGEASIEFVLSSAQKKDLINEFLTSDSVFDEDTPSFILSDQDCINAAIERDINSVNYVEEFTKEIAEKTLEMAKNSKYVLKKYSPEFLKSDYNVVLNSINIDVSSADYVMWDKFPKEKFEGLIKETIKKGYTLSDKSSSVLASNGDVVLGSVKKDVGTLKYALRDGRYHPSVVKYLLSNGYVFSIYELKQMPVSSFSDAEAMSIALQKINIFDKSDVDFVEFLDEVEMDDSDDIREYIDRTAALYAEAISTAPTVNNFQTVLQVCVEAEWNKYKNNHADEYINVFGKICTELKNNDKFEAAIDEILLLENMMDVLADKYTLLFKAMKQYYNAVHIDSNLYDMDSARDKIADLSALYVAISKENYKKKLMEDYFHDISIYFLPKKDHPLVYKKVVERKYTEKFRQLYHDKDADIVSFLDNLVGQYSQIDKENIDSDTIWNMICNFLDRGYSKMDAFIKAPKGWNNHKRYKEACRIINRLNSKYIEYDGPEASKYSDIIRYDSENNKYYYSGPSFSEESLNKYSVYRKKLQIFDKIKQQIIFKAKSLEIDSEVSLDDLNRIAKDLPFTDEYFEFNGFSDFSLSDLAYSVFNYGYTNPSSILDDKAYEALKKYVINNGLVWFFLLAERCSRGSFHGISDYVGTVITSFDYMQEVIRLSKIFDYDINNYQDVLNLYELRSCADDEAIAILGKDVILKLCRSLGYTSCEAEDIVAMAKELVCDMAWRDKSTIPYVSGGTDNYNYSIYDSQDETLLLAGIDTNACFKIGGNDHDFLHYCALSENGFVIKITDVYGNFIGRAAGVRSGNGIFINQLRTIYDDSNYCGGYNFLEQEEIIEVFKKACEDIVETSQNNDDEKYKIDFVFVNQSYILSDTSTFIDFEGAIEPTIGCFPVSTCGDDWYDFVSDTANLYEVRELDDHFTMDYGSYNLICMAASKRIKDSGKLKVLDILGKDVKAVYARPRNKIIVTENPDSSVIDKINKIKGMYCFFNTVYECTSIEGDTMMFDPVDSEFESVSIKDDSIVFVGDNWYIIYNNGNIVDDCLLKFDERASIEFKATVQVLKEYSSKNLSEELEQVSKQVVENSANYIAKALRLRNKKIF